ncbi:MAG: hypothetical protein FWC50_04565, partial [Planctomycetaceae bacterium]|nr:hypothetical protein [Planctomycetaceae bacterium]
MNIGHFYSKYKGYLKPLISGAVILFVVIACYNMLKEVNLQAIKEAIRNIPISSVGWAFVATAVSFLMLFGYEWSANKYVKGHLTLKNLAFGSFCSFAVSNALGLAVFSGGTIRYRLYKHHGLDTLTIAKISLFASFAFNVTVPLLVAVLI